MPELCGGSVCLVKGDTERLGAIDASLQAAPGLSPNRAADPSAASGSAVLDRAANRVTPCREWQKGLGQPPS